MPTNSSVPKLGLCSVPCGTRGPWTIDEFEIKRGDSDFFALAYNPEMYCPPGKYKRLLHKDRGVVMSNTRMERNSNWEAYRAATGRVLINGLGLGMLLEAILQKPDVTYVRVVEIDADVIALVGPHFADPRVEIIQADAMTYRPAAGERFNFVWHDIWDDISVGNFPAMNKLVRSYVRFADKQGCWSRDMVRRDLRRNNMTVADALRYA